MFEEKRVLIVEDECVLAVLYQHYLQQLGIKSIKYVLDGHSAIKTAREFKPDLILMDIVLGQSLDGIDAIKQIHTFSDVPVIYITGNSDPQTKQRAKGTSYHAFLTKPVDFDEIKKSIEQAFKE